MPKRIEFEKRTIGTLKNTARRFPGWCLCFALMFGQSVFAQYRFESWMTDDGLPQNGVRGIAQTPDGYLWLTTFDGLVRFDGVKFTVFDKNNSMGIVTNRFSNLYQAKDGSLIAGSEDGGLIVFRNGMFKSYTSADGLPSNIIELFATDKLGEFYISTGSGNFYFRNEKFEPVPESNIPGNGRFYLAPSGNLWTYDEKGLINTTPTGKETFYPLKIEIYNDYFTGVRLFEDSSGNLWFGDLRGVYSLKDGKVTKFSDSDGVPSRVTLRPYLEDNERNIWFVSALPWIEGSGIFRFRNGKFTKWGMEAGLSSNFVANMFLDREGSIWVATDRGLNRLQKQFINSYSTSDGLIYDEVYPLLESRDGSIYVGTTLGLSRFNGGNFENLELRNNSGDKISVTALYEDDLGRLWIGAVGDLHLLENKKLTTIPKFFKKTVWDIENDLEGNLWVATENGLFKVRGDKQIGEFTTASGLPSNDVKIIHRSQDGTLWFGTYGGIAKYQDGKFTTFTTDDGLVSNRVRTIYEDKEGTLWIGTYDGGLSRLRDGKFFNYTMESGLFSSGVFHIIEDEQGNFWISCNKGIYRVRKSELEAFSEGQLERIESTAYGKYDGMINTECNGGRQPAGLKASDGRFWFPTQGGAAVFDPKDVSFNPQPPPVQIESILVERVPVDPAVPVMIQANEENIEIRFTGISFIKPEQVTFRYRIEGLDDKWVDVGIRREVYFPFLPAGEYVFEVTAANSDGVWNQDGARVNITVNAPFWRTTWFFVLLTLTISILILSIFRIRERELKRRQIVQQEFSRRILELQEQERKRFASEMHDSLGQYLLAIKNWALFGLNSLSKKDPAREYLNEVSETSSLAIEEVREIAHNLRPYQLERLGLTNTLEHMLKKIKSTSEFDLRAEIENIDEKFSKDNEIIFYRIVQECLNNVIKHSGASIVRLSFRTFENGVRFDCQDNGKGFNFEKVIGSSESGLGLNGIIERVKILEGECKIDSEIGKGTHISIRI